MQRLSKSLMSDCSASEFRGILQEVPDLCWFLIPQFLVQMSPQSRVLSLCVELIAHASHHSSSFAFFCGISLLDKANSLPIGLLYGRTHVLALKLSFEREPTCRTQASRRSHYDRKDKTHWTASSLHAPCTSTTWPEVALVIRVKSGPVRTLYLKVTRLIGAHRCANGRFRR